MSPSAYISAGSLDGTTNTISNISAMSEFKQRFPFMETYTIEMVLPGQSGTIQMSNQSAPFILWGAELKPSFFDAELITPTNLTCYNDKYAVPGMEHSGDLTSNNHFMHSVRCSTFTENIYAVAAVAYNSSMANYSLNRLVDYEAVSPFILLVDHSREIMYAVPFSLERATIGDSMMIAPLIFHMNKEGFVRWYVPATCPTDGRVATGEYTNSFKSKMREIATSFDRTFVLHQNDAPEFETASVVTDTISVATADNTTTTVNVPRQIVFVQDGVTMTGKMSEAYSGRMFVNFGTKLHIGFSFEAKPSASIILPILSGEAHGHAALALANTATTEINIHSSIAWRKLVDLCPSIIVYANDGPEWYEGVLQAQTHRIVGLMIVRTSKSLSTNVKERQRELSDLKLCCVRMMAGVSIIVVQPPTGPAYFYRGATAILPIVPTNPRYGDPIDLDATLSLHFQRSVPVNIGSFVPQTFNMVLGVDGLLTPATEACRYLDLAMEGGVAWENVSAQISVSLSTAEADAFKTELNKRMLALEDAETKSARDHTDILIAQLKKAFKEAPSDIDLTLHTSPQREAILEHKKTIREIQSVYREALSRVEQICSLKLVSARKIGVQQAQRKMAVTQNVARAENLTASQLANKMIDSTWGFAVARINVDAASEMLHAISRKGMDIYLQDLVKPPLYVIRSVAQPSIDVPSILAKRTSGFVVTPNCTMLDPESVQIMLEHKQETHILSSTSKQLTFCLQGVPHLVLPLFNDASAFNGDYIDFMNRANDEHAADYRVTLRNMLSNLKARFPIKPSSPDLTFGIQMIVLSLIHSITTTISDIATLDPICTVCQTIRGLFYLWGTFAGSGQKPVTFAYQLTQPGAKLTLPKLRGEWTIYAIVAHIYPYLRLPLDAFKSNIRTLLVRVICRNLVAPLFSDIKKDLAVQKQIAQKLRTDNRNKALRWNYAACAVLTRILQKSLSMSDGIISANKLLQVVPDEPTYTTKQLTKTLTLIVQGQPVHWDLVRSFIACAVIKRSGFFAKHKNKMTVAALTRAKVNLCQQINLKMPGDIVMLDVKEKVSSNLLFCGKMMREDGRPQFIFKDPAKKTNLCVQNEKAYMDDDISKMKGDAELTRKAWRIHGDDLSDGMTNADFLRNMLPTLVDNVSSSAAKTLLVAKNDMPKHCADNKALVELWEMADTLHPSMLDKAIPTACMRTLFAAIGVSDVEQAKAVGDIVHMLLEDPKNIESNEHKAVQHLKAVYDTIQTVQIE